MTAGGGFRALIRAKLEQGLSGVRIFLGLRDEHQFTASYSSVRWFVQGRRKLGALPVGHQKPVPARKPRSAAAPRRP